MTDDLYLEWLCKKVGIVRGGELPYFLLAKTLHETPFLAQRDTPDMNRAYDGMHLRSEYTQKHGPNGSSVSRGACSFLELMIGMAKRMAFLMENKEKPKRVIEFFWKMVENLKLAGFTDPRFDTLHGETAIRKALDHVNKRDYMPNGDGGLFPIRRADVDMRNIELWYQMHLWLSEAYGSEIL